jgi:diguanylate cyclase (GGDEF)-like protein/PAS domain S-box-containing protein
LGKAQANLLYANLPLSALVSLICALMVGWLLNGGPDAWLLNGWLACMLLLQVVRLEHARRYRRAAPLDAAAVRGWLRWFIAGTLAAGLLWGLLAGWLFPDGDPVAQTFLAIVLAGLSGGAVTTLSVSLPAMLLFTLPTLGPLAVRFAMQGATTGWMLSFLVCLFIFGLLAAGRRAGRTINENEVLRLDLEAREALLEQVNHELRGVFDNVRQFFALLDADGRLLRGNRTAVELCGGRSEAEITGLALVDAPCWQAEQRAPLQQAFAAALAGSEVRRELPLQRADGTQAILDLHVGRLADPAGGAYRLVVTATDLTDRIAAETRLRGSEEKFRRLVERSLVGVYIVDGARFSYVNPVFAEIFGYRPEEIVGALTVVDLVAEQDRKTVAENIRQRLAGEVESLRYTFLGQHRDGHPVEVEVMGTRAEIDGRPVIIGTLLDITENRRSQRDVERLANYDVLTELANRRLLAEAAERMIADARRSNRPLTFMFLDLDRFKNVNDVFGHGSGDRLLVQVGRRLQRCLRDNDLVARMGGDEFGFLLPDSDVSAAAAIARRLIGVLDRPFEVDGQVVRIGCSIGIAELTDSEPDFATLARCTDIAMYRAKRRGNSYAFYESGEALMISTRFALENDLRAALATGALQVHYQPRIDLQSGRYDSVEALARWDHPERGAIPPGVFVPIAEESGLVRELGSFMLRRACEDLAGWHAAGLMVRMAVNLSVFELQDPDLVARIARTLEHYGLAGEWLEVEITESVAMSDPEANCATLERLKALGMHLSIDDFGTGYSSLSYLKKLPADYLKIDRSFVDGVTASGERNTDADIVRAIIALAQGLQLEVIAEGVEAPDQEAFLRAHGCHYAQGYHYCRPEPEQVIRQRLRAQYSHLHLVGNGLA